MQRMLVWALGTAAGLGSLLAQVAGGPTTASVPPEYRGVQTRVSGVFVTPVPNVPMTATVDISSTRVLPNGSTEMRKTENHIARDSRGRIYNEMRRMVSVRYLGTPPRRPHMCMTRRRG